jgi:hypothetical protein
MPEPVLCPKCRAFLTQQHVATLAPCAACGARVQLWIFPAWFKALAAGRAAENLIMEGESSCFYHAGKQAVVPCDACGRFLCSLCDCEIQGQHFCPGCVSVGRSKGRLASLEPRRMLYDSLALTIAIVGCLTGPLGVVCGPAAAFVAIRFWTKPSSIIPRTKVRAVIAIILGLALFGFWSYWIYRMFTNGDL